MLWPALLVAAILAVSLLLPPAALIARLLQRRGRWPGQVMLRFPSRLMIPVVIAGLLGLLLLLVSAPAVMGLDGDQDPSDTIGMFLFGSAFLLFSAVFLAYLLTYGLSLDHEGLAVRSWFGRPHVIRWEDVTELTDASTSAPRGLGLASAFSRVAAQQQIRVHGRDGSSILVRRTSWQEPVLRALRGYRAQQAEQAAHAEHVRPTEHLWVAEPVAPVRLPEGLTDPSQLPEVIGMGRHGELVLTWAEYRRVSGHVDSAFAANTGVPAETVVATFDALLQRPEVHEILILVKDLEASPVLGLWSDEALLIMDPVAPETILSWLPDGLEPDDELVLQQVEEVVAVPPELRIPGAVVAELWYD